MKKFFLAIWQDPVGSKVIAAAICAVAALVVTDFGLWGAIWGWLIGDVPVPMGLALALMVVLVLALWQLSKARGRAAGFKPITVIDNRLKLKWELKKDPAQLRDFHRIDEATPSLHLDYLSGPFDQVCDEAIGVIEAPGIPLVAKKCQGCGRDIYNNPGYSLFQMRLQALQELQRLMREGKMLKSGSLVVLTKPLYWKGMTEPK